MRIEGWQGQQLYECSICLSNTQLGPHLRQRLARRDFSGKIFEVESLWYADQLVGKMTQTSQRLGMLEKKQI